MRCIKGDKKVKVELLQNTSLTVCAKAIRTCWDSHDKSDCGGEKDLELIDRIGNKFKHASTLEHLSYTFYISGVSRALLQELARHRMASPSVKSTRYTLKELKAEEIFDAASMFDVQRAKKYLVFTGNNLVDTASVKALENLRHIMNTTSEGNDITKYCLPESYKTELAWTINARSLQNFIHLRSSKSALWEIRDLANAVYNALPEDHKYLFTDCLAEV
jgi:thymidylate synthase (FAD)